jgi:hypothetical protein
MPKFLWWSQENRSLCSNWVMGQTPGDSWQEYEIFVLQSIHTGPGPPSPPAPYSVVRLSFFLGGKRAHLFSSLRLCGAISPLPHVPSWRVQEHLYVPFTLPWSCTLIFQRFLRTFNFPQYWILHVSFSLSVCQAPLLREERVLRVVGR